MQEHKDSSSKSNYIEERRKRFLWGVFSLVMFGAILYFASIFSDYAKKNNIENFDDAKDNVLSILKKDIAIFPEHNTGADEKNDPAKEEKSVNILKSPLLLNCSVENGKAVVKEPFNVAKNKVSEAVFELANHGNTLYSMGFSSKENSVFCRGTMKEGEKKIFVYYCEKI